MNKTVKNQHKSLRKEIHTAVKKRNRHKQQGKSILAQSVFLGTIGGIIVIPIVAGAYIGLWLDRHMEGFSFSWTLTLIVIGVVIGTFNAIYFVKEH